MFMMSIRHRLQLHFTSENSTYVYKSPFSTSIPDIWLRSIGQATIAFAEPMTLPLDLHFTDPALPLFIDIEGDNFETLFVISTSQVGASSQAQSITEQRLGSVNRKRVREDDNENGNENNNHNDEDGPNIRESVPRSRPTAKDRVRKPMKAVQRGDPASVAHAQAHASRSSRPGTVRGSMPPPQSIPFRPLSQTPMFSQNVDINNNNNNNGRDPLFLPGSQLSVVNEKAIRDSGLGIESMGADELAALLEGDGEEVGFDFESQKMSQDEYGQLDGGAARDGDDAMEEDGRGAASGDSFEVIEDVELEATQAEGGKVFISHTADHFVHGSSHISVFTAIQTAFRRLRCRDRE
jgi:cell cycle checkpoint control protein RAD9A